MQSERYLSRLSEFVTNRTSSVAEIPSPQASPVNEKSMWCGKRGQISNTYHFQRCKTVSMLVTLS